MYPEGEALILAQLQNVSGFNTSNTSRGDWGILNSGSSRSYGLLKPGTFTRTQGAVNMNISIFTTIIQVWERYKDDGTTLINLESNIKAIIKYFDKYRKTADATGTIVNVLIAEGREVEEMWTKDGGLSWLKQDLIVQWQEHDEVNYAE